MPDIEQFEGETSPREAVTPSTHLMVAWPAAAVGALILALAALIGLVIVVTSSEVLSTVAIVLAIIAFVVQVIVFIVQMQTAAAQAVHAQELHGQMQGVLAGIQERTQGTQQSLEGMNATLLEAALGRSLPEAEKSATQDGDAFVRDLAERTMQTLLADEATRTMMDRSGPEDGRVGAQRRRRVARRGPVWPSRPRTDEDRKALSEASAWPEKTEAENVLQHMEGVPTDAVKRLIELAEDEYRSLEGGDDEAMSVPGYSKLGSDDALVEHGLVMGSGYLSPSGREIVSLSPLGRVAARLVFAPDPVPEQLRDERLTKFRAQLDAEPESAQL